MDIHCFTDQLWDFDRLEAEGFFEKQEAQATMIDWDGRKRTLVQNLVILHFLIENLNS